MPNAKHLPSLAAFVSKQHECHSLQPKRLCRHGDQDVLQGDVPMASQMKHIQTIFQAPWVADFVAELCVNHQFYRTFATSNMEAQSINPLTRVGVPVLNCKRAQKLQSPKSKIQIVPPSAHAIILHWSVMFSGSTCDRRPAYVVAMQIPHSVEELPPANFHEGQGRQSRIHWRKLGEWGSTRQGSQGT